jgi:hypothetical protein
MSLAAGPSIVTSGLVLDLDARNIRSYPNTGTTWYDRSGNGFDWTLPSSGTYNASGYMGMSITQVQERQHRLGMLTLLT